jgi:hypothetical protein
MATKDELLDENATLKAEVSRLTAQLEGALTQGAGVETAEVAVHVARSAAWVEAAGLQVLPDLHENGDVKGWLLCSAEGLPVDGVIFDGAFVDAETSKTDEAPTFLVDHMGVALVDGAVYEYADELRGLVKLDAATAK